MAAAADVAKVLLSQLSLRSGTPKEKAPSRTQGLGASKFVPGKLKEKPKPRGRMSVQAGNVMYRGPVPQGEKAPRGGAIVTVKGVRCVKESTRGKPSLPEDKAKGRKIKINGKIYTLKPGATVQEIAALGRRAAQEKEAA